MQWADDGELAKRPVPRAVVAVVVEVRAVDHKGKAMLCREFLHVREERMLAVVAAVFRVLADMRHREDWERHDVVLDARLCAEGPGIIEHIVRDLDEERRVDAAREGHGDAAEPPQDIRQPLVLLAQ